MRFLAVVLAMATFGAGETSAQCLLGRCGPSFPVGASSIVSVQNVVQPTVSQRVRTGLFGRTVISAPRVRNRVVQQVVQQQVALPQVVSTVQTAPVVASFAPLAISGGYSMNYSSTPTYGGSLAQQIRAEAGENEELLDALREYLQSLHLQVTGDGQ